MLAMNKGEMFIISENEAKAMKFSSDFEKYAREKGIRNPFTVQQNLFAERMKRNEDGSVSVHVDFDEKGRIMEDPRNPSRAEKDAWIKMRDEYVARRCFEEIGYESFYLKTSPERYYDISYMRDNLEFVPCKAADHQCTFDCVKFAECVLNGTWSPD